MNFLNHFSKKQLVTFGSLIAVIIVSGTFLAFSNLKRSADTQVTISSTATMTFTDSTGLKTIQSNTVTNLATVKTVFFGTVNVKDNVDPISNVKGSLCQVSGSDCNDIGTLTINSTSGAFSYSGHLSDGWYGVKLVAYNGLIPDSDRTAPETHYFHVVNASMPPSGIDLSTTVIREKPVYKGTLSYQGWNVDPHEPSSMQGTVCDFKIAGLGPISMTKTVMSDDTLRVYSEDLAPAGTKVDGKITTGWPYGVFCTSPQGYTIGTTAMQKVGGIVILIVMPPVNFKITDPNVPTESIISMVDGPPTQSITVKNYDSDNNSALAKVKITRVSNGINQTSSTALNSGKFNNLPLDTYELQSFSDDGRSSEPTQVVLTPTSPSITIDLHFRTIVHVSVDPNGITALNNVKGTLCQVVGSGCTDVGPMTMDANGVFSYGATNLSDGWYGVKIVSYDGPVSDPASKQLSVIKAYPETRYFHLVNSSLPAGGIDLSTITVKEISNYNETVAYDGWGTNSQPPVGFQGLTCNVKDGTTTIMTKVLSAGGVMKLYAGDIASVGTTESGKLTIDKPYTLNCSNPGYKWSPSNPNPTITVHTNTCLMLGVGSYKCGQATVKMSDDNAPGSINVTNYDSIGNPVASGIKITRKSNGVSQVTSSVNSNTFVNLPLDEYDLQSFSDGNFSSDIFPVVLSTTSPTRTIDLRLKGKSATITGEINPGTSATLAELLDSSHNPLYSVTGPGSCGGGFFCLLGPTTYTFKTDVSPGTYYVRITSQGYDTVNYTAIVKTVDDNIDLGLATLVPSQSPLLAPVNEPASAPVSSAPPSLSSIVPTDTPVTSQSLTQSLAPDQSTVVGPTENTNNPVNTPVPTEATVNNKLITGAIIDTNNKPITGADVTLVDSTSVIASSKTNDQGRYSLSSDKIDLSKKYTLKVVKGVDYTKDISFTPKTANANIKIEQNKWFVRLWLRIKSIF